VRYTARAPLRVDFGGGWTDAPEYARDEGGAVLNAAITRYVRGSIVRPQTEGIMHLLRGDRSYVQYSLDLPPEAGLGAYAAQTVLWVTLVKMAVPNVTLAPERCEIAEIACRIAEHLGILDGKQDEYASALGGITYYTFGETVEPHRLELPPAIREELHSRLVLVYTGRSRLSRSTHEQVWSCYRKGDKAIVYALASLKQLATEMKDALLSNNLDSFADLMGENWRHQKALHPSVSNPDLDELLDFGWRHGARAGKACGVGGGGCLVFMASRERTEELRGALTSRHIRVIDFEFDTYGGLLKKG